jgi:hypothetical protein
VIACLLCASRIPAAAQGDPGKPIAEDAKRSGEYSATASVGFFVLGSALSVYTHETGHWLFAYVAGATDARMSLFPPKTRMQFRLDASTFQKTIPVLAGPLTTRVLAEGVDHYLNATLPSRAVEAVGGATYLAMRFDLPWQVLTSAAWHFAHDTANGHDDIAQGFVTPWFATRRSQNLVYAALVAAETLDIWLDAGEIAENFARLRGRPRRRHGTEAFELHPVFDASSGSLGVEFHRHF